MLIMVSLLAACGGSNNSSTEPANNNEGESEATGENTTLTAPVNFLRIGSGPMGSGWYPITTLTSEIYMDSFDGLNVSQLEGGSTSNLRLLEQGQDIDMAINFSSDFADALNARGDFETEFTNIAAVASLYPAFSQIATLASRDDINSVEDIVSKHVFLGPQGGGSIVGFWRVMEEYGITEETFKENGGRLSYGNYNDGASMLSDGNVDVFFGGGAPGVVALHEMEVTNKVKIIPIDEEKLTAVEGKGYGMAKALLPANTYDGQTEDIPTWTMETMFTIKADLDEEFVYNLTKVLWDNLNKFEEQLPARAAFMSPETALNGLEPDQLHPGALKYYKELGVVK